MKFYKEAATGLWIFNGLQIPAGELLVGYTDDDLIYIRHLATPNINAVENKAYSYFKTEAGAAYASLAAFKTATNEISLGSQGGGNQTLNVEVEITRPENTTVYAAGDVIADVSAAFIAMQNVALASGKAVMAVFCRLDTDDTGLVGTTVNIHLYKSAPTFIADNAAFALSYANAKLRKGKFVLVMSATGGMNDFTRIPITPAARDIYYIAETPTGFTPSANSTKLTLTIGFELSN